MIEFCKTKRGLLQNEEIEAATEEFEALNAEMNVERMKSVELDESFNNEIAVGIEDQIVQDVVSATPGQMTYVATATVETHHIVPTPEPSVASYEPVVDKLPPRPPSVKSISSESSRPAIVETPLGDDEEEEDLPPPPRPPPVKEPTPPPRPPSVGSDTTSTLESTKKTRPPRPPAPAEDDMLVVPPPRPPAPKFVLEAYGLPVDENNDTSVPATLPHPPTPPPLYPPRVGHVSPVSSNASTRRLRHVTTVSRIRCDLIPKVWVVAMVLTPWIPHQQLTLQRIPYNYSCFCAVFSFFTENRE